jgi:hypothetical protein
MNQLTYQTKRKLVRARRILRWWPWLVSVSLHVLVLGLLSILVLVSYTSDADTVEIIPTAKLGTISQSVPLYQQISDTVKPEDQNSVKSLRKQITEAQLVGETHSGADKAGKQKSNINPIGVQSGGSDMLSDSFGKETSTSYTELPGGDLGKIQTGAPVTRFFSAGGNAYNIVYVVDRSASMTDTIRPLKNELKRSIRQLQPMQKFHVIFFSSGQPVEGPGKGLCWATDRNKRNYFEFINQIKSLGQTDPQWAIQRALQMKPDLIYLLTDGIFGEKIANNIITWAKLHRIKVNTIAYVWESGGSLLRKIAEETRGVYRFVSAEQLEWDDE